jgi:hypothetical protein
MIRLILRFGFASLLLLFGGAALFAQDSEPTVDDDRSSEKVEQKDDSYRQQMELEDARSRDRTYIDNTYTQTGSQEKIDKLPEESRDNIRDQLVDIIVENGEWEPKDALAEYPYTPTASAESDSELKKQEQEAWDEQIEKYHEREAAAFGTHRGPVPGPGNPSGQEGGQQGDGAQPGQQGSGGGGQDGEGKSGAGSAGTYQPYQSNSSSSDDEISTAGVSESALDFLKGGKGRQQAPPQGAEAEAQAQQQAQQQAQAQKQAADQATEAQQQAQAEAEAQQQMAQEQAAQENTEQAQDEQQSTETPELDTRGIIAIRDLDKLEGTGTTVQPEDQEDP